MALVASVGAETANSFVTETEAGAFFGARLQTGAWDSADEATREKALRQAVRLMETFDWRGWRTTHEQALSWPRIGVEDPDRDWSWFEQDEVPQRVKDAQMEIAIQMLEAVEIGGSSASSSRTSSLDGISRVKVGDIEVQSSQALSTRDTGAVKAVLPTDSSIVTLLLKPLVRSLPGGHIQLTR